jgi:hypothetical protein
MLSPLVWETQGWWDIAFFLLLAVASIPTHWGARLHCWSKTEGEGKLPTVQLITDKAETCCHSWWPQSLRKDGGDEEKEAWMSSSFKEFRLHKDPQQGWQMPGHSLAASWGLTRPFLACDLKTIFQNHTCIDFGPCLTTANNINVAGNVGFPGGDTVICFLLPSPTPSSSHSFSLSPFPAPTLSPSKVPTWWFPHLLDVRWRKWCQPHLRKVRHP